MGEYAEAHLWGEMNGRDMDCPEDWEEFYQELEPITKEQLGWEGRRILSSIKELDEEKPAWENLMGLLDIPMDQALVVVQSLDLLASFDDEGPA